MMSRNEMEFDTTYWIPQPEPLTSEQLALLDKVERLWLDPDHVDPPITQQSVLTIRRLRGAGKSLAFIAGKFGVSTVAIHKIVTGKSWSHVPDRSV